MAEVPLFVISTLAVAPLPQLFVTTYLQVAVCASDVCAANKLAPRARAALHFLKRGLFSCEQLNDKKRSDKKFSCRFFIRSFSCHYLIKTLNSGKKIQADVIPPE